LYTRFVTGENAQVAADWIKQTASTVGDISEDEFAMLKKRFLDNYQP
jgi:hypothetical protein